jgi:hypothetical protein
LFHKNDTHSVGREASFRKIYRVQIFMCLTEITHFVGEHPTHPVDLRDDGDYIDLPSREEIEAAYDTIIKNKVYVGMSELNFPTKIIRLTKATLTIVTCCVKIQTDCSESFETRQGLRQGDVLSTLLFNIVLEVIVRRANLQTNGTICNKETQQLAYADDIDIVSRSQSAVRDAY